MNNPEIEKAIGHLTSNDKCLSTLIKKIGKCNLKPNRNHFAFLVDSIISQQLSSKAADSISLKFRKFFEEKITPENILYTGDATLRQLGLSFSKIKYVKDLSCKIVKKEVRLKNIHRKSDEEIMSELIKVKGIGTWTVHMFLIFGLGRLNVLPVGDLGIRKAIMKNYRLRKLPDEKKIRQISSKNMWNPYNSVACWYFWRSLDQKITGGE